MTTAFTDLQKPSIDAETPHGKRLRLPTISGVQPLPFQPSLDRELNWSYRHALAGCRADEPDPKTPTLDHNVACFHPRTTKSMQEFVR